MIVSFSEVFKWDTCRRQYYYSFIKGLRPIEESEAIATGNRGHKLLQNFYNYMGEGHSKDEAAKLTLARAQKMLAENKFDTPLLRAWTLVDNYIRTTEFNAEAVIVEERFLFPLSRLTDNVDVADVQVGFTPDVVFKRQGGFYDVEDAKFVGRAWSATKLSHFSQAKLYQIFLQKMGYNISRSSVRFFNTQTGEVKTIAATLENDEEQTIISDFVEAVTEVVEYRDKTATELNKTRRTFNYTTCQYCSFNRPCKLEKVGKDASKTFDSLYVKSNYDYSR